jgi:hypothetical protein
MNKSNNKVILDIKNNDNKGDNITMKPLTALALDVVLTLVTALLIFVITSNISTLHGILASVIFILMIITINLMLFKRYRL